MLLARSEVRRSIALHYIHCLPAWHRSPITAAFILSVAFTSCSHPPLLAVFRCAPIKIGAYDGNYKILEQLLDEFLQHTVLTYWYILCFFGVASEGTGVRTVNTMVRLRCRRAFCRHNVTQDVLRGFGGKKSRKPRSNRTITRKSCLGVEARPFWSFQKGAEREK